jgi:hypothetical protein
MKNLSKGENCGSSLQPIVLDPEEIVSAAARRWGWQGIGRKKLPLNAFDAGV